MLAYYSNYKLNVLQNDLIVVFLLALVLSLHLKRHDLFHSTSIVTRDFNRTSTAVITASHSVQYQI